MADWSIMGRLEWVGVAFIVLAFFTWTPHAINYFTTQKLIEDHDISKYYRVEDVLISDVALGDEATVSVDREILQPFSGEYTVVLYSFPDREIICTAGDSLPYSPDANQPDPITFAWWANDGECTTTTLPAGQFFAITRWKIDTKVAGVPVWEVIRESPPFVVSPWIGKEPEEIQQEQRQLEQQIENLTRSLEAIELRQENFIEK